MKADVTNLADFLAKLQSNAKDDKNIHLNKNSLLEILESKIAYSVNLHNIIEAKSVVYDVADVGGFDVTSREGLETLRKVYNVIDILHYKADRNKKYGKIL